MFLPEEYEAPTVSNNYVKLKEGENRIRILSQPILGWEDWVNNKPVRYKMDNKPLKSSDPKRPIRHFWSFIVFNYNTETVQIMHVTQGTIRRAIEGLCKDKDWGAPYFYDIKIAKSGDGMETKYVVNPVPHKAVDEYIVKIFKETPINLTALFEGADPFSSLDFVTPLALDVINPNKIVGQISNAEPQKISSQQAQELVFYYENCSEQYKNDLMNSLGKMQNPVSKFEDVTVDLFEKLKSALKKNYDEHQTKLNNQLPF